MYRDDESAARVRRDELAAELAAAKAALAPDRAALDERLARARTKKILWTTPPVVLAVRPARGAQRARLLHPA